MGGRHTGGGGGWGGSGLANINLEQHARQDQIARVSRATVAEVVGGGHATGLQAQEHTRTSSHICTCCQRDLHGVYATSGGMYGQELIWVNIFEMELISEIRRCVGDGTARNERHAIDQLEQLRGPRSLHWLCMHISDCRQ